MPTDWHLVHLGSLAPRRRGTGHDGGDRREPGGPHLRPGTSASGTTSSATPSPASSTSCTSRARSPRSSWRTRAGRPPPTPSGCGHGSQPVGGRRLDPGRAPPPSRSRATPSRSRSTRPASPAVVADFAAAARRAMDAGLRRRRAARRARLPAAPVPLPAREPAHRRVGRLARAPGPPAARRRAGRAGGGRRRRPAARPLLRHRLGRGRLDDRGHRDGRRLGRGGGRRLVRRLERRHDAGRPDPGRPRLPGAARDRGAHRDGHARERRRPDRDRRAGGGGRRVGPRRRGHARPAAAARPAPPPRLGRRARRRRRLAASSTAARAAPPGRASEPGRVSKEIRPAARITLRNVRLGPHACRPPGDHVPAGAARQRDAGGDRGRHRREPGRDRRRRDGSGKTTQLPKICLELGPHLDRAHAAAPDRRPHDRGADRGGARRAARRPRRLLGALHRHLRAPTPASG